ncbi:MAG: hypothetical protein QM817_04045 [Archangium sp.]
MRVLLAVVVVLLGGCSKSGIPKTELGADGPRGLWWAETKLDAKRRGILVQAYFPGGVLVSQPKLLSGSRINMEADRGTYQVKDAQLHRQIGDVDSTDPFETGTDDLGRWFLAEARYRPLNRASRTLLTGQWISKRDRSKLVLLDDDPSWKLDGYQLTTSAKSGLCGMTDEGRVIFDGQLYITAAPNAFEQEFDNGMRLP